MGALLASNATLSETFIFHTHTCFSNEYNFLLALNSLYSFFFVLFQLRCHFFLPFAQHVYKFRFSMFFFFYFNSTNIPFRHKCTVFLIVAIFVIKKLCILDFFSLLPLNSKTLNFLFSKYPLLNVFEIF